MERVKSLGVEIVPGWVSGGDQRAFSRVAPTFDLPFSLDRRISTEKLLDIDESADAISSRESTSTRPVLSNAPREVESRADVCHPRFAGEDVDPVPAHG